MALDSTIQRIVRLTPLGAILALVENRVAAVSPEHCALAAAYGRTLAEDVATAEQPERPIALRDGFAVAAAAVADAGPYLPLPFASMPARVDVGEPLPPGTDTVMPFDAVMVRGNIAEAIAPVVPGEGVLPAGGDATAPMPLRRGGERLRAVDVAVMTAAGLRDVKIRSPRIRLIGGSASRSTTSDATLDFLSRAVTAAGCRPLDAREEMKSFDAALTEPDADAVIGCGGTGSGRRDTAVQMLAALGRVEVHGIAVSPGETAAFGFVGERPVLLVPGRLDAALAIWLLIGRYLAARLAGGSVEEAQAMLPLKRKVTSTIGLTELMPVACDGAMAEPLAAGYLSFASLTRSGGWMVVPADSEGYAAGTPVAVRPWP